MRYCTLLLLFCQLQGLLAFAAPEISLSLLTNSSDSWLGQSWDQLGLTSLPPNHDQSLELFGRSSLETRQQRCINPGYGKCCPAGDTCFSIGCCTIGYQPCGTSKCYNPTISKCCSGGYACGLGYDCVGNGRCCPAGMSACSATTCYDPKTQKCCASGGACSANYDCQSGGGCCPVGETRCGTSNCYNPSTQRCCTSGLSTWGCPINRQCGSVGFCTGDTTTQLTTARQTTTPRLTTPQPSTSAAIVTSSASSPTSSIVFKYDPNRKVRGSDGKLYDAQNKAILENMCRGISSYLGSPSQSITLTRTSRSQRRTNRRAMCPRGYCASALREYISKYYPSGIPAAAQQAITMARDMSCDEFPFAISAEGGNVNRGVRFCVPSAENSWQGGIMGNFFKAASGIAVGSKFTVVIDGFDCTTLKPTRTRRRDVTEDIYADAMWKGYDDNDPSQNLITMPIGDLAAGTHTVRIDTGSTSRSLLDLTVTTYDGQIISSTTASDGTITFTLDEDEDAVSVVGTTTQNNVTLSYTAENTTQTSSSSSSSGPSSTANISTSNGGRLTLNSSLVGLVLMLAVIYGLILW